MQSIKTNSFWGSSFKVIFTALALTSPSGVFALNDQPLVSMNAEELKEVQKIRLIAKSAQITILQSSNEGLLFEQAQSEKSEWEISNQNGVLELREKDFSLKKNKPDQTRRTVTLTVRNKPLEIFLDQGLVSSNQYNSDMRLQINQGKIQVSKLKGMMKAQLLKGEVSLIDLEGRISLDLANGSLTVKNLIGSGDFNLFKAQTNIEKAQGNYSVKTNDGSFKLNQFSSGSLVIDNAKATLSIQNFKGRLEGMSQEGAVTLGALSGADVQLKTTKAKVQIQMPPQSGGLINLLTQDGEVSVPSEIRVVKGVNQKSAKGRLRGRVDSELSILVRSEEGTILLK